MGVNPYIQGFYTRLTNRYSVDAIDMSMSTWIEKNTRLRKKPFSFADYWFQRAIVDDLHPNMDVIKCSQVGLTETQIRKAAAFCVRNVGVKLIFTLPNEKMFKRVSQTRIQPMVADSPVFNPEGAKDWIRSMGLMQFDQSFLYVTGATEGDATSIDADAVFNDEVDLTDQQMLALFNSRMQNSKWRMNQRFSTPTHVGYGIDKGYGASDQNEYMCKCRACNHWNIPDFNRNFVQIPGLPDYIEDLAHIDDKLVEELDLDNAVVVCEQCGAPLDLDSPEVRQWVPRFPGRSQVARGYYVRPFVTSRLDVKYIVTQLLKYKQRDYIRGWYNTVLGKAYTDGSARLAEAEIKANLVRPTPLELDATDPCFVGIDVGATCHVVIGKHTPLGVAVAEFLTVQSEQIVQWVEDFCATHNVIGGGIDRYPYTPTATAVFEASKGKIFPVEYRGAREVNPVKSAEGDVIYFQANRTQLLDEVVRRIRKKMLPMAGYGHFEHVVIEHLRDMVRDEKPEEEAKWVKLNGNDHYFHAIGFMLFGSRINEVLALLNEEDVRTMIGIIGVDMKQNGVLLPGVSKKQREVLYSPESSLVQRRYF